MFSRFVFNILLIIDLSLDQYLVDTYILKQTEAKARLGIVGESWGKVVGELVTQPDV